MAKDPAVLFYSNDFLAGTFTMTYEQKGKYITLLCLQHQQGHLSEKHMLSVCSTKDPDIWCKFKCDEDGNYYNQRMEEETIKRCKFSESRRLNASKKESTSKAYAAPSAEHMDKHMENENIDIDIKPINKIIPPSIESVIEYCEGRKRGVDPNKWFDFYSSKGWMVGKNKMKDWQAAVRTWEQKDAQQPTHTPPRSSHIEIVDGEEVTVWD